MVLHSPGETVALMHKIADALRRRRSLVAPTVAPLTDHLHAFRQEASDLHTIIKAAGASEPETEAIAAGLAEMAAAQPYASVDSTLTGLVAHYVSHPHPDL